MSNGINGALIAQSGKVCYNIDASIRDKAFRMVFIRLSEFYQVQYITLTKGCQESFSVSLYTPLSVCYTLSYYREQMRLSDTYSGSIIHGFGVWFKQGEVRRLQKNDEWGDKC